MKKIQLQCTFTAADSSFTEADLLAHLQKFGEIESHQICVVDFAPAKTMVDPVAHWVRATCDDSDPYTLVSHPGSERGEDGEELNDDLRDLLQKHGVCTKLHGVYPRADRYGVPEYGASDEAAHAVVSEHFVVASDNFEVMVEDSGDDSPGILYFKVLIPAILLQKVPALAL